MRKSIGLLPVLIFELLQVNIAAAVDSDANLQMVSADACDERLVGDDKYTARNRAIDKASLAAVKLSGFIQKKYPDLSVSALDTIAYRIIDEYMLNVEHDVTLDDGGRVCVNIKAAVEISPEELASLVEEYKDSTADADALVAVAEKINNETHFKPQSLQEKKLLYIRKMRFWDGNKTDHYRDFLAGLFAHSEYFYVTEDEKIADFIITPNLIKADVYELDKTHHKLEMVVELKISAHNDDFEDIKEQQQHFILFAADKDEQDVSDGLLRKMLAKTSADAAKDIERHIATLLEREKLHGK